jgi:hypothetical protein
MGDMEPARSMGHNTSSLEILKFLNPFGMRQNCNTGAMHLIFYILLVFNHDSHKTVVIIDECHCYQLHREL